MIKLKDLIFELLENVPQKGISSGDAIKWKSDAKVIKKDMTLDEILNNIKGVLYYKDVVDDYDKEDYSWDVTEKVVEYAEHFKKHPESIANYLFNFGFNSMNSLLPTRISFRIFSPCQIHTTYSSITFQRGFLFPKRMKHFFVLLISPLY